MKLILPLVIAWAVACAAPFFAQAATSAEPLTLTLEQAEARLLSNNRDILAGQRAVESADAVLMSAGARPNPQVSINSVSITPSRGLGAGTPYDKRMDTTLRVDQLIERGGKRALRMRTARQLQQASQEDLSDTRRQLQVALDAAYYDLLLAQDKMRLTADSAQLAQTALDKAELRLKAGDLAASEVAGIRVDTLRVKNDAAQAAADVATARLALAYLIGADADASRIQATSAWPAPGNLTTDADIESLIARRPDMRAAQTRVDAARSARDLVRAQRVRDISVGAQVEHYPPDNGNSFGVGVSFPLFFGNNFEGDIRGAEVALSAAQDNLERTHALALGELTRARNDLNSSAERLLRYQTELIPAARRAADAAEFAFAHGAISAVDVLDARRTWRAIQIEALTAQADYARAAAAWRINTQLAKDQ